jgi:tRNA 2-(methylsulfanyl)-N6-isopentenyladenosine37 hydroxylase
MLLAATPRGWVQEAGRRWQTLLVDHANCEKKAASTALALLFAYPEDRALCMALARLAREELRHFEQVQGWMLKLGVNAQRLSPGRYAGELRSVLINHEPQRKIDLLLCGALIEARSCERFELLAPELQDPLAGFYAHLAEVERRHQGLYLSLAQAAARGVPQTANNYLEGRLAVIAAREAQLATEPDAEFRFHSGPPLVAAL